MTSRPGGEADKAGNRYEYCWAVNALLDVMRGEADRICLEPSGPDAKGIEFWIDRDGQREYHQAKREAGYGERWTLARLARENVLASIENKLNNVGCSFVFVSGASADELQTLSERALGATSGKDYRDHSLSKEQANDLDILRNTYWQKCSDEDAWQALKRVQVELWPEKSLKIHVLNRVSQMIDGDEETAYAQLVNLIAETVDKQKILTAHQVWSYLKQHKIERTEWWKDKDKLSVIDDANNRYVRRIDGEAINNSIIPRTEAETIIEKLLDQDGKRIILVTGEAGNGKSGTLCQVIEKIRASEWPVLCFRLDNIGLVNRPEDIGLKITGLAKSPARILAMIAQDQNCLLVIDQLDAVSMASGRHPENYEVIDEIVRQAGSFKNMRVILACRNFDVDNDPRLHSLKKSDYATTVSIGTLSHEIVREVMGKLGYKTSKLDESQLRLLAKPLHLRLLELTADISESRNLDFKTDLDLYNEFWKQKHQRIRDRIGSDDFVNIVDAISDYMSDNQTLAAPEDIVDKYRPCANVMVSEHVLVLENGNYSFFHEGFFDYAFGRRFASRGGSLLDMLKTSEEHLFRRSQVRQILLHERRSRWDRYIKDLEALLTDPLVRQHIKEVVWGLLSHLTDPSEREWTVIANMLSNPSEAQFRNIWRVVLASMAWFGLLDSLGLIKDWLVCENEQLVQTALRMLLNAQSHAPDRVIELLEPYIADPVRYRNHLLYMLRYGDISSNNGFSDLFRDLVELGLYDESQQYHEFWIILSSLAEKRPEVACKTIRLYFERLLQKAAVIGETNAFDRENGTIADDHFIREAIESCAQKVPTEFAKWALPFLLKIANANLYDENTLLRRDRIWGYRSAKVYDNADRCLLAGLETSLGIIAKDNASLFRNYVEQLRESNLDVAQFLLIRAYTIGGEEYSDELIDYFCNEPTRLSIDYIDSSDRIAVEALKMATVHCSESNLRKLESVLLEYVPEWEWHLREPKCSGNSRGITQFALLEAISIDKRSEAMWSRLREWSRKFNRPIDAPYRYKHTYGGLVGSPIPDKAISRMTDEHWLSAIKRYSAEDETRIRDGHFVGGAHQLSQVLEQQAKNQPGRFCKLALMIPDNSHPHYFDSILRGVTNTGLATEAILELCERCHRLPKRPCGRWIPNLIGAIADRDLPKRLLDIVSWYATENNDPVRELWKTETNVGNSYFGGDPHTAGINSVRGTAALAIEQLISANEKRLHYFRPVLDKMVEDPSIAVRSCVAQTLMGVLRHDRDLAVNLFLRLVDTDEMLLTTSPVEYFIHYASASHFDALQPMITKMTRSESEKICSAGARQASVAVLRGMKDSHTLLQQLLNGRELVRKAVAEVFSSNISEAASKTIINDVIIRLFNDESEEVRSTASECFHNIDGIDMLIHQDLIQGFIASIAFKRHSGRLMQALTQAKSVNPELVCYAGKCILDDMGSEAGDSRKESGYDAMELSKVILRTYTNANDHARKECLDLIDRMIELNVYGLNKLLETYNR